MSLNGSHPSRTERRKDEAPSFVVDQRKAKGGAPGVRVTIARKHRNRKIKPMKSAWEIVVPVACVALICAAGYLLWKRASERRAAEAFAACRIKAEQGDAKSQYELGGKYFYGLGVPKDLTAWAEWCRKAAEQGNARAETQLGNTYYYGWGVSRDFDQALFWYHKAAGQGEPEALKDIGYAYSHGNGVAMDYVEAVRWYRLSADKGYAAAESNLGYMYNYGFGVPRDLVEANRWYRKAADGGDAYAQIKLGLRERPFNDFDKLTVGVELTGSLMLLLGWPGNARIGKSRRWNLPTVAGSLGLFYVAIVIYSHSSLAVFRSPFPLDSLEIARGLIAGLSVATLLGIVLPKQQWRDTVKYGLWLVCAAFLAINVVVGALVVLRGIPAGNAWNLVRHLCFCEAGLFGWALALFIFLRWKRERADDNEPMEPRELKAESCSTPSTAQADRA